MAEAKVKCGQCGEAIDEPPMMSPADRNPCPKCGATHRKINVNLPRERINFPVWLIVVLYGMAAAVAAVSAMFVMGFFYWPESRILYWGVAAACIAAAVAFVA